MFVFGITAIFLQSTVVCKDEPLLLPCSPPPCRHDKARENNAALEVLPDLLAELDAMAPPQRLLALLQVGGAWGGVDGWVAALAEQVSGWSNHDPCSSAHALIMRLA